MLGAGVRDRNPDDEPNPDVLAAAVADADPVIKLDSVIALDSTAEADG